MAYSPRIVNTIPFNSRVELSLYRKGVLVWGYRGSNLVTQVGKELYAELASDDVNPKPAAFALGDGADAVDESQVDLQGTEHIRVAFVTTRLSNEVTYSAVIANGSGGTWTVSELGIFNNAGGGGIMSSRFLTTFFEMLDGDTLDVAWTLTFG